MENRYYDEKWIIGKNYSQIVERYGEFDEIFRDSAINAGFYLYKYRDFFSRQLYKPWYHIIYFSPNGIAVEVSSGFYTPKGG